jgi:hypothetical protein
MSAGWTTPRRLRVLLAAAWLASGILFLVGLGALARDRAALRAIARESAPSIVVAEELGAHLADLDTELANSLLGSAADRDVANELFELRRSAANRKLVEAGTGISHADAQRVPIVVMSEELGRYLELASRAQWLYDGGDKEGALSLLRVATATMHARILPAAAALDAANRQHMDAQYARARSDGARFEAWALISGALLVAVLVGAQVFVRRRMRRRFVPALLAATVLAIGFTWYLVGRFGGARENLRVARDDAFNSIHALWRARALAYDAAGDQSRWLLDRTRAGDHDAAFHGKVTQLLSRPGPWRVGSNELSSGGITGLLVDEAQNVTFAGEDDAANATIAGFTSFLAVDDHVRALEKQGKHAEAVDIAVSARDDASKATFDRFDAAVQRTIAINQRAFDGVTAASDRALGRAEWLDPAFALGIALLAWLGLRPRLREYA